MTQQGPALRNAVAGPSSISAYNATHLLSSQQHYPNFNLLKSCLMERDKLL